MRSPQAKRIRGQRLQRPGPAIERDRHGASHRRFSLSSIIGWPPTRRKRRGPPVTPMTAPAGAAGRTARPIGRARQIRGLIFCSPLCLFARHAKAASDCRRPCDLLARRFDRAGRQVRFRPLPNFIVARAGPRIGPSDRAAVARVRHDQHANSQIPRLRADRLARPPMAVARHRQGADLVLRRSARRQPGADRADGRRAQEPHVRSARRAWGSRRSRSAFPPPRRPISISSARSSRTAGFPTTSRSRC